VKPPLAHQPHRAAAQRVAPDTQANTDRDQHASVDDGRPTLERLHRQEPSQPPNRRFPLPDHPAWIAFYDGYLAGITHGIGMGRAQVSQEVADAATFHTETPRTASHETTLWAADGLSRAEWIARRQAERAAARTEYHGPSLTGEQIRENAYRSWGLTRYQQHAA
jgi:hypothetical protein